MATPRDDRPAVGTLGIAAGVIGIGGLVLLDFVLGQTYFGVNGPALWVGLLVGATIPLARRRLLLASLLAVAASLATSYLLDRSQGSTFGTRMSLPPRDDWPGMAEAAGLLLLLCWSLRALVAPAAIAVTVGVGTCFVAIVEIRNDIGYDRLFVVAYGLGFSLATGAGLYLRWIDHERRRDLGVVRQQERLAIARELHDVVAHHVTGIVVQAQAAQAVWSEQPEVAPDALARIEAAGAEALASMRRLVSTLRADEAGPLAPAATLSDLQALADRSTAMGLPVHLHFDGVDELPPSVAPSIHRVVGEAITNAQRHASGATVVEVRLRAVGDELTVEVVDDGDATRAARSGTAGYGLTGMAERTEALGGRFEAGPVAGGGWRIRARLPLGRTA
jgi:signal transduction histidine kinase